MALLYADSISLANSADAIATGDVVDGFHRYFGTMGDSDFFGGDVDIISIDLLKGELLSADTVLFGVGDTIIRLFDGFGNELGFDDDGGTGLASLLEFTAPAANRYYVAVSDFGNSFYNPNIPGSGVDEPVTDYIYDLVVQVRDFNPLEYIASYSDLSNVFGANAAAGQAHFNVSGSNEGRDVTFNGLEYIASNFDLIFAFGTNANAGASHYINFGRFEGRSSDSFDARQYLENYADLRSVFGDDTQAATRHYITNGVFEGRTDIDFF